MDRVTFDSHKERIQSQFKEQGINNPTLTQILNSITDKLNQLDVDLTGMSQGELMKNLHTISGELLMKYVHIRSLIMMMRAKH